RRAGPLGRAVGGRPGVLLHGGQGEPRGASIRAHQGADPERLFRALGEDQGMTTLNTIVQGVLLGGLYALYAAGLSLIFGVMRLVNLAHGDFIVLAAYVILALGSARFIPPVFALLIALPFLFALGWALQRVILNRTVEENFLVPRLATCGLQIIIQNGILIGFSADSQRLSLGAIETLSLSIGALNVGVMPLLTFGAAILVIGALSVLFYTTALGRKLRATSDSATFVQIVGINPRAVFAIAMG